jgi:hypothetical protein
LAGRLSYPHCRLGYNNRIMLYCMTYVHKPEVIVEGARQQQQQHSVITGGRKNNQRGRYLRFNAEETEVRFAENHRGIGMEIIQTRLTYASCAAHGANREVARPVCSPCKLPILLLSQAISLTLTAPPHPTPATTPSSRLDFPNPHRSPQSNSSPAWGTLVAGWPGFATRQY